MIILYFCIVFLALTSGCFDGFALTSGLQQVAIRTGPLKILTSGMFNLCLTSISTDQFDPTPFLLAISIPVYIFVYVRTR